MKIRKLQIQGFKSFADRVVLNFDTAISGVVGPNGCGKSNVVDAIRWVMGEQSARKLRGSQMKDIIFNGSEDRGPMGMAEVSVTFENDGQSVPPEYADYSEISVSRRLYRSGDSEYLINNQQVRLRDITDLFLGTGVGAKAYAIVEQDRVAMLVNAKAEERRRIIEEAAGITKYKTRRAAAERKLEATEHNLARISDVVREVGKRLNSLRRQARKAARYKRLREEIQHIDLHRMSLSFFELSTLSGVDRGMCSDLTDRSERLEVDLRRLEADIEASRLALLDDDRRLSALQGKLYELDSQVQLAEQGIAHNEEARERIRSRAEEATRDKDYLRREVNRLGLLCDDLRQNTETIRNESSGVEKHREYLAAQVEELGQLKQKIELSESDDRNTLFEQRTSEASLRNKFESTRQRAAELCEDIGRLEDEQNKVEQTAMQVVNDLDAREQAVHLTRNQRDEVALRVEITKRDLDTARNEAREADEKLLGVRAEVSDRQSRLGSLKELERTHAAAPEGVQQALAIAEAQQMNGIRGLVADAMMVPEELETGVAALFGLNLQAILVEKMQIGIQLANTVREKGGGRVRFFDCRDVTPPATPKVELPSEGVDFLANRVRPAPGYEDIVHRLLGGALVVDSVDLALRLRQRGLRLAMVTPNGELLDSNGVLAGGSIDEGMTGALRQRREMRELEQELEVLQQKLTRAQQRCHQASERVSDLGERLDQFSDEQHQLDMLVVEKEQEARTLADQASRLRAESDSVGSKIARMEKQQQRQQEETERISGDIAKVSGQIAATSIRANALQSEGHRVESKLSQLIEKLTEIRVRAASSRERFETTERQLRDADTALTEQTNRLERLERTIERDQADDIRCAAAIEEARENAKRWAKESHDLRETFTTDRTTYETSVEQVNEMEGTARESRTQLQALREELSESSVRLKEREVSLQHLRERALERYDTTIEQALYDYHMLPIPKPEVQERRAHVQRIIESMGEINLAAATEYEELDERHTFLHGQRDDLTHAVGQLRRAIVKIDRTTKIRFREAFDAINEKFQQVFPRLFGGGQARLELVTPEEILTSGIEIYAQPPGKRLQAVSLMSGGEKALTAISLIFSVFLIKPSPFCLLDEVDAPLDDANVGRFTDLLKDISNLSQFVFISHNRATMEVAERLYGVTMEKPGISKIVSVQLAPPLRPAFGSETEAGAAA